MTKTKATKKKAVTTNQLGDDDLTPEEEEYLIAKDDWIVHNPQVMMEQKTECDQLRKDIELYLEAITTRHKGDDQLVSLDSKLDDFFALYEQLEYGIKQWWKYTQGDPFDG